MAAVYLGYLQHNPLYYPSAIAAGEEYMADLQRQEAMKQATLEADEIRNYVLTHDSAREVVLRMVREKRV